MRKRPIKEGRERKTKEKETIQKRKESKEKKKKGERTSTQRQEERSVSESGDQPKAKGYFANGKSDPQIGDTVVFISLCFKTVSRNFSIRVNSHIRFGSISNQAVRLQEGWRALKIEIVIGRHVIRNGISVS